MVCSLEVPTNGQVVSVQHFLQHFHLVGLSQGKGDQQLVYLVAGMIDPPMAGRVRDEERENHI